METLKDFGGKVRSKWRAHEYLLEIIYTLYPRVNNISKHREIEYSKRWIYLFAENQSMACRGIDRKWGVAFHLNWHLSRNIGNARKFSMEVKYIRASGARAERLYSEGTVKVKHSLIFTWNISNLSHSCTCARYFLITKPNAWNAHV